MYNVGDKVRIVKEKKGGVWNRSGNMDKWLGKIMTIKEIAHGKNYNMIEDDGQWYWHPDMIEGFVESQQFDYDMIMQKDTVIKIKNNKQYRKIAEWADSTGLEYLDGTRYTDKEFTKYNYKEGIVLNFNEGCWMHINDLKDEKVLTYKEVKLPKIKTEQQTEVMKEDTLEWSPKDNEDYWYILTSGAIRRIFGISSEIDKAIIASGKAYPTKESCELASQMDDIDLKYAWIKNYVCRNDDGWRADWNNMEQKKYGIYYNYCNDEWCGFTKSYLRNNEPYMSFEMQQRLLKILNKGE